MTKEVKKEILEWIYFLAIATACTLLIQHFIIFNSYIPSSSMENTIMTGDRVLGLRLTYTFGEPKRYDIAIFRFPDDEKQYFVKRVIGMPGEKVEIKKGKVYINDAEEPLRDDFVKEPPYPEDFGPYTVEPDHYFMLGDNRNVSKDSRRWVHTTVARNKVLAKAYVRLWPNPSMVK